MNRRKGLVTFNERTGNSALAGNTGRKGRRTLISWDSENCALRSSVVTLAEDFCLEEFQVQIEPERGTAETSESQHRRTVKDREHAADQ